MGMKISEIPYDDRPREKALKFGIQELSDAELLALIFRSGIAGVNAIEMGENALSAYKNLYFLSKADPYALKGIKGLNSAKITTLLAVFEIAKRIDEIKKGKLEYVKDPLSLSVYFSYLEDLNVEEFILLALDKEQKIILEKSVWSGAKSYLDYDFNEIISVLDLTKTVSIVIIHNHPKGSYYPSENDLLMTAMLNEKLRAYNLYLFDHIIIANGGYYSFLERKKY